MHGKWDNLPRSLGTMSLNIPSPCPYRLRTLAGPYIASWHAQCPPSSKDLQIPVDHSTVEREVHGLISTFSMGAEPVPAFKVGGCM